MRVSRWTLLGLLVIGVLVVIEGSILVGLLRIENLIGFFFVFVYGLVVIAVLAIVGAVFFGMYVSHRILSTQAFTPFEEEMLRMREDVKRMAERLDEIAARLGAGSGDRR
ncbi:MAG: hypothetical protein ACT4OI_09435 [Methanobacteriota archaeon]